MTQLRRCAPISKSARAVVTGAGSGIGRALALELARRNATVVCSDLSGERAEETAALVEKGRRHSISVGL